MEHSIREILQMFHPKLHFLLGHHSHNNQGKCLNSLAFKIIGNFLTLLNFRSYNYGQYSGPGGYPPQQQQYQQYQVGSIKLNFVYLKEDIYYFGILFHFLYFFF